MPIVVMRILTALRRRIRWKLKLPRHPSQATTITTEHRRIQRVSQLDWNPERTDDDGYPLVDGKRVYSATRTTERTSGRG